MRRTVLFLSILFIFGSAIHAQQDIFKKHGFNKEPLTLSKGKYKETFTNEDVMQIGTVLIDTRTEKIVEFLEEDMTMFAYKAETSSRFLTIDPHAERYYNWWPYVYCYNNPMRFIDPDGRDPGDKFKTKREAAKDWGKYYNGASIIRGQEFASTIYKTKGGSFVYTEAAIGKNDNVNTSTPPNGEKTEGLIHSHGKFEEKYENNKFSNKDKRVSEKVEAESFVATPDGSLKKYDPTTKSVSVVSTDLPNDPKDPDRKNDIKPVDIPKEKENEAAEKRTPIYRGYHGE